MTPRRVGFTLIELLVALAIIAILSALALTLFSNARINSSNTAAMASISEAGTAIQVFRTDSSGKIIVFPGYGSQPGLDHLVTSSLQGTTGGASISCAGSICNRDLRPFFSGTQTLTGLNPSYGASISKTADPQYTYSYAVSVDPANPPTKVTLYRVSGTLSPSSSIPNCWIIQTNLRTPTSATTMWFAIRNGVATSSTNPGSGENCATPHPPL